MNLREVDPRIIHHNILFTIFERIRFLNTQEFEYFKKLFNLLKFKRTEFLCCRHYD
jgi:hypothetical protein